MGQAQGSLSALLRAGTVRIESDVQGQAAPLPLVLSSRVLHVLYRHFCVWIAVFCRVCAPLFCVRRAPVSCAFCRQDHVSD